MIAWVVRLAVSILLALICLSCLGWNFEIEIFLRRVEMSYPVLNIRIFLALFVYILIGTSWHGTVSHHGVVCHHLSLFGSRCNSLLRWWNIEPCHDPNYLFYFTCLWSCSISFGLGLGIGLGLGFSRATNPHPLYIFSSLFLFLLIHSFIFSNNPMQVHLALMERPHCSLLLFWFIFILLAYIVYFWILYIFSFRHYSILMNGWE